MKIFSYENFVQMIRMKNLSETRYLFFSTPNKRMPERSKTEETREEKAL